MIAPQSGFPRDHLQPPRRRGNATSRLSKRSSRRQGAGLEARYLPVTAGKVTDEDAEAFGAALPSLPGPVLAYCRTGTRSATLWSLAEAETPPAADILAATQGRGLRHERRGAPHRQWRQDADRHGDASSTW
jgi:sulfide:quinone oxidoreductase